MDPSLAQPDRPPHSADPLELLCRQLAATKGYAPLAATPPAGAAADAGVFPELAPLWAHFDRVLVRHDGFSLGVLCIKDRSSGAAQPTAVDLASLREIGSQCLKYCGKLNGTRLPVGLQVVELGRRDSGETRHLMRLRSLAGVKKVAVLAWSLNLDDGSVWTNARWGGRLAGRGDMQRLLAAVRAGTEPVVEAAPAALAPRPPLLTYTLIAVLGMTFAAQLAVGGFEGPLLASSAETLLALGGLSRPAVVDQGQWWRVFSAALLHANAVHLLANALALYGAGRMVEQLCGAGWLLALFGLSLLGGSAAGLLHHGPGVVSVGASGGILGVLNAALLVSSRLPFGRERTSSQMHLLYWLIPALVPLSSARGGGRIDFAAHAGGAFVGLLIGTLLVKRWAKSAALPPQRQTAAAVGAALLLVAALGVARGLVSYRQTAARERALRAQLAPEESFASLSTATPQAAAARLAALRARYPRDPRTHYYSAVSALQRGEAIEATAHLQRGLADPELLRSFFEESRLEVAMRVLHARLHLASRAPDRARATIRPLCSRPELHPLPVLDPAWVRAACAR